jgi:hypothetical protein
MFSFAADRGLHVTTSPDPTRMSFLWFYTRRHAGEGDHEKYSVALCVMRRTVQSTNALAHEHSSEVALWAA